MKAYTIAATALCVNLGLAVPLGIGAQALHKRAIVTSYSISTEVVTVTDYNAVVWVDEAGSVVTTEHKTLPPASATATTVAPASVTASPSVNVNPVPSPGDFAGRPDPQFQPSDSSSSEITPTSSSSASHTFGAPPAISSGVSHDVDNNDNVDAAASIQGFSVAYDASTGSSCRPGLDSDFAFLSSKGVSMIRVYDICFTESVNAAAAHNLKLMIGLTTFENFDDHLNRLIKEVTSTSASWSRIDTVFIGNELVNKHQASAAEVAGKVSYARGILKARGFYGNVVTVDTWTVMRDDATICSTSDYCAANAHAFFDGNVLPAGAGPFVRMAQGAVASKSNGKRVVITESGWPHAGNPIGKAVPSVENQHTAMASIVKEFAGDAGSLFLFMAYDATYKPGDEIERNFGIFDAAHYNSIP